MHTNHPIIINNNCRDKRRNDQITRQYTVKFNDKLKVTDNIVISIQGSRIEHFGR